MGPNAAAKGKPKPPRKGVTIKTAPPKQQASKEKADLLDFEDEKGLGDKKTKASRCRSLDETVRKKVRDNFPGFTEVELTLTLVDGMNVYERIRRDLEKNKIGERITMGKAYYATLRDAFRDPESNVAKLQPTDLTEDVDKDLERALMALLQTRRSSAEIHQWCEDVVEVTQLNIVALFRQLLSMPATKSLDNANIGISVLKMCSRLNVPEAYPEEWACVRPHMDQVLLRTLTSFKAEEQTTRAWWAAHKKFAALVLPSDCMTRALSSESDWGSVAKDVHAVAESSEVGRRLMARALRQLELEAVGAKVSSSVGDLAKQKHITKTVLEQNKKEFVETLKGCMVDALKPYTPRKEVELQYRGVAIKVIVASAMDHHSVAIECFIRSLATDTGKLVKMWCEDELVGPRPEADGAADLDDELLVAAKTSRQALVDGLADGYASAANVDAILKAKKVFLAPVDRFSRVEVSFWQSTMGEMAADRVRSVILSCLPESLDKPKTMTQSLATFEKFASSALLAFAGPSQQTLFKTIINWLLCMDTGRCPEIDKASVNNTFTNNVKDRLMNFLVDPADKSVHGLDLLNRRFAAIKKLDAAKKDIKYSDLAEVVSFSWLLGGDDKAALKATVKRTLAAQPGPGVASGHAGSGSASSSSAGPSAKKARTDAKRMVKALFSK